MVNLQFIWLLVYCRRPSEFKVGLFAYPEIWNLNIPHIYFYRCRLFSKTLPETQIGEFAFDFIASPLRAKGFSGTEASLAFVESAFPHSLHPQFNPAVAGELQNNCILGACLVRRSSKS